MPSYKENKKTIHVRSKDGKKLAGSVSVGGKEAPKAKKNGELLTPVKRAKIEAKRLKREAKIEANRIIDTYRHVTRSGLKIMPADFPGYPEANKLRQEAKAKGKEYIAEARKISNAFAGRLSFETVVPDPSTAPSVHSSILSLVDPSGEREEKYLKFEGEQKKREENIRIGVLALIVLQETPNDTSGVNSVARQKLIELKNPGESVEEFTKVLEHFLVNNQEEVQEMATRARAVIYNSTNIPTLESELEKVREERFKRSTPEGRQY